MRKYQIIQTIIPHQEVPSSEALSSGL